MSELEDFEAFIEDGFDPIRFAASLLQATNVVDDTELDLSTPLKKLQFDVTECNKRMETLASTHHAQLLQNVEKVELNKKKMDQIINPSSARLKTAFERINEDVIVPHDEAVKLNNAIQKIHQTSSLLRSASFFVVFLQQLLEAEKLLKSSEDEKEVIRVAKSYKQVASIIENAKSTKGGILSLKIVRDYAPIHEVKSAEFVTHLTSKITNDMGHHSSFTSNNTSLVKKILALYIMDKQQFASIIDKGAMMKSIQISLSQLTRSLQSPRTLASAFSEIRQNSANFSTTLSDLLENCDTSDIESTYSRDNLLNHFLSSLPDDHGTSIEEVYWTRLALKFKKSVAATMARGGPIARNLRTQHKALLDSVDSTLEGHSASSIKDALSLITNIN